PAEVNRDDVVVPRLVDVAVKGDCSCAVLFSTGNSTSLIRFLSVSCTWCSIPQAPNFSSQSGATFQMSSLYSRIARSDEKYPQRATLRIDIRAHCSGWHQICATRV